MTKKSLSPVIGVDDAKCTNCHTCIEICPVKFCIDGSGDVVRIDHDRCIGCGRCIDACHHDARFPIDDGAAFFDDIAKGKPVVAIIAPAAASGFAGKTGNLVAWLRSIGVKAVFDASFGAELAARSYIEALKNKKTTTIIAQPCPAIVTYIELYRPELLEHLAPVDSPIMHSARLIRAQYPEYANAKIAALTPCLAKKREFDETGVIDYNVTFLSVMDRLKMQKKDLLDYRPSSFDGSPAERAAGFPLPGGLMRTVARDAPDIAQRTRTIEGTEQIYQYLDTLSGSIKSGIAPLVVDCLNCSQGCIVGPGCQHRDMPLDLLKNLIEKHIDDLGKTEGKPVNPRVRIKRLRTAVSASMKYADFTRRYVNRSENNIVRIPQADELTAIYALMGKTRKQDLYDCQSCGYGCCESMAIAIHNGLNKPDNCHHYQKSQLLGDRKRAEELTGKLHLKIVATEERMRSVDRTMIALTERCAEQAATIEESSAAIESLFVSLNQASQISGDRRKELEAVVEEVQTGRDRLSVANEAVQGIRESVAGIGNMSTVISEIAGMINLLSMNAAIEAAHAGDAGKGFAVISGEVKRLADSSTNNSAQIAKELDGIERKIAESSQASLAANDAVQNIMHNVSSIAKQITGLLDLLSEMASGSTELQEAVNQMRDSTVFIRDSYDSISRDMSSLAASITAIRTTSDESLEQIRTT